MSKLKPLSAFLREWTEREVSSVMRAVDYSALRVKCCQSGDFIKTQEFTETPGGDDIVFNDVVRLVRLSSQARYYEEGGVMLLSHGPG